MSRCSVRRAVAFLSLAAAPFTGACDGDSTTGPGAVFDVARIMAVGDSYLAGVSNGALYASAQQYSVPALFAALVAPGSEFAQPLVSDPGIATEDVTRGRFTLVTRKPLALARQERGQPLEPDFPRPFDNLAVPNALVIEAPIAETTAGSIFGNFFYDVVLRGRGTFAEQVAERDATLLLVGIGNHDVLTYLLRGGDPDLAPGLPTTPGSFGSAYGTLLDQLSATTDEIVLFNIPDFTLMPIVHAIPNVVLDPATGDTVQVTVSVPIIDPITGEIIGSEQHQEPVALLGPDGPLAEEERVSLDALPFLEEGVGVPTVVGGTGEPLPDAVVLDAEEIALIRATIAGYNAEIAALAAERNLPVVDVHGLVEELATTGVVSDGILLTTEWLFGQAISLDGYTFTPKGYGLVTNLLVDVVNAHYGTRLPHIRTANLPGIPLFGF